MSDITSPISELMTNNTMYAIETCFYADALSSLAPHPSQVYAVTS